MNRAIRINLLFLLLSGCATSGVASKPSVATSPVSQHLIELEPTVILGNGDSYTVKELFERAYTEFEAARYEEAASLYLRIVSLDLETSFLLPALFNLGLAYEKLGRLDDAAHYYRRIIADFSQVPDTSDASFRYAAILEKQQQWQHMIQLMRDVQKRTDLDSFDQLEARMRIGWGALELGDPTLAVSEFQKALAWNNRLPVGVRVGDRTELVVRLQLGVGLAYQAMGSRIPLVLPPERMQKDLERKAEYILSAQNAYLRALAAHDPTWSLAAGFQIGLLYEAFYRDIFSAEIPDDLDDESLTYYFKELREKLDSLLRRADRVYSKTLHLADRLGNPEAGKKWIANAKEAMRHLRLYLEDPPTQARAERFVRRGDSLTELFSPFGVVRDAVIVARQAVRSRGVPVVPSN